MFMQYIVLGSSQFYIMAVSVSVSAAKPSVTLTRLAGGEMRDLALNMSRKCLGSEAGRRSQQFCSKLMGSFICLLGIR